MNTRFLRVLSSATWIAPLLAALSLLTTQEAAAAGVWTALSTTPGGGVNTMLLLSDGTVMAQNGGGTTWYRLTPDTSGNYATGTWTTRNPMSYTRLYYSSALLRDGRLFVAGAELGTGTTNAEVYNPVNNSWTYIPVPPGLITTNNVPDAQGYNSAGFYDSGCKITANGKVLIEPVFPAACRGTVLFDPISNTLSLGPSYLAGRPCTQDEASWVKLPDNSLLTLDSGSTTTERYIPASNTWISDTTCPVALYDPFGTELGPAFLLPNGKAIFFGSSGHSAIYTPSGSTSPGTWVAGPDFPNAQGMPDAPGAMMVDGKILLATSPVPVSTNHFPSPTSYYEYDYTVGAIGAFTRINGPTGLTSGGAPYPHRMLDLPNGQVLYTTGGSQLYVYTPSGAPLAAGKPTISTVTQNADGSYHLSGTKLNGISEGANYGDDAQMDSNYPLVRLSTGGTVYYARTYNWSSTSVQTGGASVSTDFTVPSSLPSGSYSLVVVANGIASDPIAFDSAVWVDFTYGGALQFGTFTFPYKTLAQGVSAVAVGGTIDIKPGSSTEIMTITKGMEIRAAGGAATIGVGH